MNMKRARILITMIALGAVFGGKLGYAAEAPEASKARSHDGESRKAPNDAGKKTAGVSEGDAWIPPKAVARKGGVHPGQTQHKSGKVVISHPELKKRRDDHAPTVAGPGSGFAQVQKPKTPVHAAKPAVEIPKTEGRPKETASLAGSAAVNGTSMTALRHGGASLASVGGITPSTARGAAALNGTQLKAKP